MCDLSSGSLAKSRGKQSKVLIQIPSKERVQVVQKYLAYQQVIKGQSVFIGQYVNIVNIYHIDCKYTVNSIIESTQLRFSQVDLYLD